MRTAKWAVAAAAATALAVSAPGAFASSAPADPCLQSPSLPNCVNDAFDKADAALATARQVIASEPCLANPTLPTCTNDAFARSLAALETVRGIYNNQIRQPIDTTACEVYEFVTGNQCPTLLPGL